MLMRRINPRMRKEVERGRSRAPFLIAQKPTPKSIQDPTVRRMVERIVERLNQRVLRPKQVYNLIANAARKWIRVRNVEELAHLNGKNNYLSICLEKEKRLAPLIRKGNPSLEVQREWDRVQGVLGLFRNPATVYLGPTLRNNKMGIVILIGPQALPKKIFQALAQRMLESEEDYFNRLAKSRSMRDMIPQADQREKAAAKKPGQYKIHFHALDARTKKFRPIYGPKNEYPEYDSP